MSFFHPNTAYVVEISISTLSSVTSGSQSVSVTLDLIAGGMGQYEILTRLES